MNLVFEMTKLKFCPLCRNKWMTYEEPGKDGRSFFVCKSCMISIWVRDPMVGRWDEFEAVHCPNCRNHQMRFFSRSDGYMKWYCVDCKCSIEEAPSSLNDSFDAKNDNIGAIEHKPGEIMKIGCEYNGCTEFLKITGDPKRDENILNNHGWAMCSVGQNPAKIYCTIHAMEHCRKYGLE